jgi:outer membrane autotransporter protein
LLTKTSGTLTALGANKISIKSEGSLTEWTANTDANGNIILTQTFDVKEAQNKLLEGFKTAGSNFEGDPKFLENLMVFERGTGAEDFFKAFNVMTPEAQVDTANRLSHTAAAVTNGVISQTLNDATSQISTRIGSLVTPMAFTATPSTAIKTSFNDGLPVSGVAAGDDVERHGIWASPFYGESTQKKRKDSAGYKTRSSGLTAGFDTKATEDMIVGAAATFINTNVSHKDYKKGDKTKVDSLMFTVYGVQQMADNWYIQGVANFGSSRVKNSENKRIGMAYGNYTSMSFSGELLAGYNYMISEQAVVTPMAGFSFSNTNDSSYKESGPTMLNANITKRASNKLEGILGARVASAPYEVNGMEISPELHASVRQDLTGKTSKVDIRVDNFNNGKPLASNSTKAPRTFVNLGTSISAKYSMMEYGIGYDATMATKYIGHQGTVKVRVNF